MWIKEKFSRDYHVVCDGKANHLSEKGLFPVERPVLFDFPPEQPVFFHTNGKRSSFMLFRSQSFLFSPLSLVPRLPSAAVACGGS